MADALSGRVNGTGTVAGDMTVVPLAMIAEVLGSVSVTAAATLFTPQERSGSPRSWVSTAAPVVGGRR